VNNSFSVSENELGFTSVRIHYSADPDKNVTHADPEISSRATKWYDAARRSYPDPNKWAQEMEINWWVAAGTRVYPEFSESIHGVTLEGYRDRKIIYRAWDFGWHAPACLIAQIDSKDRLVLIREVIGKGETTREFAEKVIQKCSAWFPNYTLSYHDFCDPAGQQVNATSEKSETRDVEILNKLGIFPSWEHGWSRKDGRSLVHQLLLLRTDGTPSFYVNVPGCPVLIQGFLGKYVYPPKKSTGGAHDEPDEGNHPWADIHACLRYLATGLYSALGLRRASQTPVVLAAPKYHGYGSPLRGPVKRKGDD